MSSHCRGEGHWREVVFAAGVFGFGYVPHAAAVVVRCRASIVTRVGVSGLSSDTRVGGVPSSRSGRGRGFGDGARADRRGCGGASYGVALVGDRPRVREEPAPRRYSFAFTRPAAAGRGRGIRARWRRAPVDPLNDAPGRADLDLGGSATGGRHRRWVRRESRRCTRATRRAWGSGSGRGVLMRRGGRSVVRCRRGTSRHHAGRHLPGRWPCRSPRRGCVRHARRSGTWSGRRWPQ
jgi:hypothetical protein